MSDTAREIIEGAIYAALGCTDIRSVTAFPSASKQIAEFVLKTLSHHGLSVGPKGVRVLFDPVGQRFGRLVIGRELPRKVTPQGIPLRRWECQCDCGVVATVMQSQISGRKPTQSCGCIRDEKTVARNLRHGLAGKDRPSEYNIWCAMKRRCRSKNCGDYKDYGGRGITVCDRWNDFVAFYSDMGPRPSKEHSIDRIDNNGNYEPGNCRWATHKQQRANQRRAA